MKIRLAQKNPIAGVRTFYVQSESNPDLEYVVVEIKRGGKTRYFCNCGDFFFRLLPHLDTNLFSCCKHGKAVKEAVNGES